MIHYKVDNLDFIFIKNMEYARKVVYNGNIVDVEDIVCPGTELAHLSVGNLKKRMNEFVKELNDFNVQIKNINQNIEDEFTLIKATIDKNAKSYETTVTTRLNSEKTKYDALYAHANELIASTTNSMNELNTKFTEMNEDVADVKEKQTEHIELLANYSVINATLADQIINVKKQLNIIRLWIAALYNAVIDNYNITNLKNFNASSQSKLNTHVEAELKYDDITNLTAEWSDYLTEYHPNNKEAEE